MSYLARIRKQRSSWGRSALGLFAAVWLNLALQPCAMAYEVENDPDCAHCPPPELQGHHDMHAGMDAEMPCADGLSDCNLDPDFNHDGRGGQTQLKDVKGDSSAIAVPMDLVAPFDKVVRERSPPRFETTHSGVPPALHILYCVYLD